MRLRLHDSSNGSGPVENQSSLEISSDVLRHFKRGSSQNFLDKRWSKALKKRDMAKFKKLLEDNGGKAEVV